MTTITFRIEIHFLFFFGDFIKNYLWYCGNIRKYNCKYIYTILVYTDNVPMTFTTKRVHLNQVKILLNIRKLICVYLLLLLLLLLKCITFYFLNLYVFFALGKKKLVKIHFWSNFPSNGFYDSGSASLICTLCINCRK